MTAASAVRIVVKASGSAEPGLNVVADAFRAATGHIVDVAYSADIDTYDVLVASREAVERKFLPSGAVADGGVEIGSMALGVAVRPGLPAPDISTLNGLKRAVLDADRVAITKDHSSGVYIESMLKELGLYERIEGKIERPGNGPQLMDRLLAGNGKELGFLSINAIRTYADKGLVLVGPLPAEVQLVREFVAVAATNTKHASVAEEFVRFCGGPGRALLAANGFG